MLAVLGVAMGGGCARLGCCSKSCAPTRRLFCDESDQRLLASQFYCTHLSPLLKLRKLTCHSRHRHYFVAADGAGADDFWWVADTKMLANDGRVDAE